MAITWSNTIKQQFRPIDIEHMKQVTGGSLKLDDFDSVKANAQNILSEVEAGDMPPDGWSDIFIQNFKDWIAGGMPFDDTPAGPVGGGDAEPVQVTWTNTIKGFFSQFDIDHMLQVTGGDLDLGNYDNVKANIDEIWGKISTGLMPPGAWPQSRRTRFKNWVDAGMPETTWNSSIKGFFTPFDIDHMKQVTGNAVKLDDYENTKINAGEILEQVSQGHMPPGHAWSQEKRDTFEKWKNDGMPQ